MRVLVVDDDAELCELVGIALTRDGHDVRTAESMASAHATLAGGAADVMVLDLDLPDGSGLELCRALRRGPSAMRILILTASGDVAARVAGLDAGADDYLVKPFAVAELRARVRALGRRADELPVAVLVRGEVTLDFGARRAYRRGLEVSLTAREWAIVEVLARSGGKVVAREVLLLEVWGEASEAANASLGVLMARIRRKLGPELIRMVRGEGHALG
jgi:two-component system, OmpR family, response regulator